MSLIFFVLGFLVFKVSGDTCCKKGWLRLPLKRLPINGTVVKRSSHWFPVLNEKTHYNIEFEMGTPPQSLVAAIDTMSSDFILVSRNINGVGVSSRNGSPKFNERQSTTYLNNDTIFDITYPDNANYLGEWAQDVFTMGNVSIPNFNFGLSFITTHPNEMIGGLGLAISESPFEKGGMKQPYSNFPLQLKEHGFINHLSYSIWLNSWNSSAGLIEFGGLDLSLTTSDLYRFPIVDSMQKRKNLPAIKLNKVYLVDTDDDYQLMAETSLPIVLDTRSYLSTLPKPILQSFYEALGAVQHEEHYAVPCSKLDSFGGSIGLVFSGVEFVFSLHDITVNIDGTDLCIPGFAADNMPRLGVNILRSLYVVFDLENLEIAIALANTQDPTEPAQPVDIVDTIVGTKAPGYSFSEIEYTMKTHDVTGFAREVPEVRQLSI